MLTNGETNGTASGTTNGIVNGFTGKCLARMSTESADGAQSMANLRPGKHSSHQQSSVAKGSIKPFVQKPTAHYDALYQAASGNPDTFWSSHARSLLSWERPFTKVRQGSFADGDVRYFLDGLLNASYNCVDRHAERFPDKPAIIFESDDTRLSAIVTYKELLHRVCRLAWALRSYGVKKGDVVAVYMPTSPEAFVAVLACTRIGALHSCVFAGFSANALRDRILDANCKVVLAADETARGSKRIDLKALVDDALSQCPGVQTCIVHRRSERETSLVSGRDVDWDTEMAKWSPYFCPEVMSAESPMFLLYTSGSTGKPKGLMHTTAGFLLGAAVTGKYVFDIDEADRFYCEGDIGWITGHTYGLYAPLLLGATTIIREGLPNFPTASRPWDIIDRHGATHYYTAPTALRLLKKEGNEHLSGELGSLRAIGCVGEPLAPEVWRWCHEAVGKGRVHVLDTFFQTETGSLVLSPLAGVTPVKPGSCCFPFFGIHLCILDATTGKELDGPSKGVLAIREPWPSMARTVWSSHQRYMDVYLNPYPGYYFTGDGAERDADGYYWVKGRVDDVINVSGHRLSTSEIESVLLEYPGVAETAVIGVPDELTGQSIQAFVTPHSASAFGDEAPFERVLREHVGAEIGRFAMPKAIILTPCLPKTRSGKIMRRVLRKIVVGEVDSLGDTTTLSDPTSVNQLIDVVSRRQSRG